MKEEWLEMIAAFANGDARVALNTLEMVVLNGRKEGDTVQVSQEMVEQCIGQKSLLYDKNGEEHYNLISARINPCEIAMADAAVYWLARMLEAGEDPLYVARRLVRFADEDVGMADSRCHRDCCGGLPGMPFHRYAGMHGQSDACGVYLSMAPKSNALYMAYEFAKKTPRECWRSPVPLHLRNAPTKLMQELNYGKDTSMHMIHPIS